MKCKRKGCGGKIETEKNVRFRKNNRTTVIGHPCTICGMLHTDNGGHIPKSGSKKKAAFFIEGNIAYQKL